MPTNNNGPLCPTFELKHASVTDTGMRRTNNQDSLSVMVTDDAATWATRGHLLMVADGMGAHAAGELASKIAADNIPHTYFKRRDLYPPAALRQAIRDANSAIHAKGQSSIGFQGMGTTCSCLVLLPQGALVAHIGDSRVYRLRGQVLEQLTFDHSLVWEMMAAAGQMAETDVPAYIPKNVITRSLGPHPTVQVDLEGPYHVVAGDVFLLCSDGLSGPISDEELAAILQCLPPDEAAETLVDFANIRGGPDNISVIIARVDGEAPTAAELARDDQAAGKGGGGWSTAALWLATGACLATLLYFVVNRLWAGAIVSGVGLLASMLAAVSLRPRTPGASNAAAGSIGGPYGNGPYRKTDCPPNGRVVGTLSEIATTLRALPEKEPGNWSVDWQPFDLQRAQAASAAESGDHAAAIRQYCQAIREIMQQVREHRPTIDPEDRGSTVA
jgi:protein phosphatase